MSSKTWFCFRSAKSIITRVTPVSTAAKQKCMNCPYCGRIAERTDGKFIYPHRPDLADRQFIQCLPCQAWVGCHKDGTPLGRLANASLRRKKMEAHATFDPLWKSGEMSRAHAYYLLAKHLNLTRETCHIGEFDEAICQKVIEFCQSRKNRT